MKGLLLKDIKLTLNTKKNILVFVFIAIMFLFLNKGEEKIFSVAFLVIMFSMLVLATITYDEQNNGGAYLLSLPVNRRMYAMSKHVFSYLCVLVGGVGMSLLTTIALLYEQPELVGYEWFVTCLGIVAIGLVFSSVMTPIQIKFGADKGRYVIFGFLAACYILAIFAKIIGDKMGIDMVGNLTNALEQLGKLPVVALWGGCVALVLIFAFGSMAISVHVINKKEF